MTQFRAIVCGCAVLLAASSCAKPAPSAKVIAAATARAEKAAAALNGALLPELTAALAQGPAKDAVQVCSEVAQSVTERTVLERWSAEAEPKDWSEVVNAEGGQQLLWMRPIRTVPLCTQCHGSEGSEILLDTLDAIRRIYPEDRATGFATGSLRGAVTVRVPL